MNVCFYQAQGNTKGHRSLWAQYVIYMSYANGCVITWLVRSYPCTGTRKKRGTLVSTCAEYVHSAHKGIINQFTYFWPIKCRTEGKGTWLNCWHLQNTCNDHHFNSHWNDQSVIQAEVTKPFCKGIKGQSLSFESKGSTVRIFFLQDWLDQ